MALEISSGELESGAFKSDRGGRADLTGFGQIDHGGGKICWRPTSEVGTAGNRMHRIRWGGQGTLVSSHPFGLGPCLTLRAGVESDAMDGSQCIVHPLSVLSVIFCSNSVIRSSFGVRPNSVILSILSSCPFRFANRGWRVSCQFPTPGLGVRVAVRCSVCRAQLSYPSNQHEINRYTETKRTLVIKVRLQTEVFGQEGPLVGRLLDSHGCRLATAVSRSGFDANQHRVFSLVSFLQPRRQT